MDNPICKIICHDGKKIFVDKRLIVKRLEGAYAWLRFLEIEKSGFIASDKDADDCLTFCQEFDNILKPKIEQNQNGFQHETKKGNRQESKRRKEATKRKGGTRSARKGVDRRRKDCLESRV